MQQIREGHANAFEALVRLHEGYVYRVCLGVTRNAEDAEEAMQDTFLKAYRNLSTFRGDSRFSTWMTRIAINEGLQRLRRRKNTTSLDEEMETDKGTMPRQVEDWHASPEQMYAAEELRRFVEEAVTGLPDAYRVVLVLRDVCGRSTVEVAEALDLTIAAVKSRLLRARLMVRESLAARFQKAPTLKSKILRAGSKMTMMMHMMADRLLRPSHLGKAR